MKTKLTIVFSICIFFFLKAQKVEITGDWLMYKITIDTKVKTENTTLKFSEEGKIYSRGMDFGEWKKDGKHLILKSDYTGDEFNGKHLITILTKEELVFSFNSIKYFFKRIDKEKIRKDNQSSNLNGVWRLNHKDFDDLFLKFELPDQFTFISSSDNSLEQQKGIWKYLPENKEVNIEGVQFVFSGKSRIKELLNTNLFLVTPRETIHLIKVNDTIEKLDFSVNTFTDENSNKENQLPLKWLDFMELKKNLSKYKNLTYQYKTFITDANAFKTQKIRQKININTEEEFISISNVIISKRDTFQFSESVKGKMMNENNVFFPELSPDQFRVVGKEKIQTKIGLFNCTVVEGFIDENKFKYWMIDDSPGVFAKVIQQGIDRFTGNLEYKVKILENNL